MSAPDTAPVGPADRLLAEAVRAFEHDGASPHDEPAADAHARSHDGDLETRIIYRDRALSVAAPLRRALRAVRRLSAWTVGAALLVAALTGAGAVRAALGGPSGEPVNVFWILLSLLGLQTLLLLGWLLLLIARPTSTALAPLGGAALAAGRWVTARLHQGPHHLAVVRAYGGVLARGAIGRWALSAISHAMWVAFNGGAVVLLLVLLSTRQYVFTWETTILSSGTYERISRTIGALPRAVGFPAPTPEQVVGTEMGRIVPDPDAARAWSGLLVGAVLIYGLGPRALLLGLSVGLWRRAWARFRLDTTAPGHHRLRARLMPEAESSGVVADDERRAEGHSDGAAVTGATSATPSATGPPAIVGLEIEPPASPWPPPVESVRWLDLGFVDGRDDRHRVQEALAGLSEAPRMTAVACELTTTPDRGAGAFLAQVASAARGPVALLLTGGDAMRRRSEPPQIAERVTGWRRLAATVGVPPDRVLEIDLDHLTDASLARLAHLLGAARATRDGGRIEAAFAVIGEAVASWTAAPDAAAQADLHRRVAALYRRESRSLAAILGLPEGAPVDVVRSLRDGATRVGRLLPARLRASPRWLAAGAVTGAVGCIAIGTLLTPAAFAALPAWAAGGAGLGALLEMCGVAAPGGDAPVVEDVSDAVRAATLFALLLELQGRDEAEISRLLDRVLSDPDEPAVIGPGQREVCEAWLRDLRHRLDLAMSEEARR